eukprot:CAMPEP_0113708384 /NCGR_PEP_ID=MMETSP0038_2-20120614/28941_1 /TAXON_ID=2898 /ORGANISM="Cryptomonas paramecium" /LENGTH=198 /DNA_ID=CAMNT_0000634063 /DNA_START=19 /DNA_END=612 /DNA_ORIENTATION=+ /assembly_acc=CAM_ASM_000170
MKYPTKTHRAAAKPSAAVKNPEMFVSAFALAVTCGGSQPRDWIARTGRHSLQNTLERMLPEGIFSESGKRCQVMAKTTTALFHKVLESRCGFKTTCSHHQVPESGTDDLVFCNRRYLRPSNSADRELLAINHEALCFAFPCFSRCSLRAFFEVLEDVSMSWECILARVRSRSTTPETARPSPPATAATAAPCSGPVPT